MILLVSCLAWVMVNVLEVHKWHKVLNRKPFACDVCLSGWLALPYCWHGWYTPLYMSGAMVAVILINKLIRK